MDAAQVIDFVDETKAFPRRGWVFDIVVSTTHVDAFRRAHSRTQFASNALFHAIGIAIEHMTPVESLWLWCLLIVVRLRIVIITLAAGSSSARVVRRHPLAAEEAMLTDGDAKSFEVTH